MSKWKHKLSCILCVCVTALTGACSPFSEKLEYNVVAFNYGEHGIILRNFPVYNSTKRTSDQWLIEPGIPGVWGDVNYFEQFVGYPNSLPDTSVVTWQLATLSDCEDILTSESMVDGSADPNMYTRKEGCDWTPLEGQIFTRELDMDAIRNSEAYKKAGTWVEGMPFRDYYLVITLIFRDDQLIVETSNSYHTGL
jgi:hypothetical protein